MLEPTLNGTKELLKHISLRSDTLISLGLLEAEMTKHNNNVVFSNSEPLIIKHIIEWFEKNFGVPRNKWRWLIQFNKKLVELEGTSETKSREFASFLFWIKNIGIDKNNHFPKWITYRGFDKGTLGTEDKWGMLSIYLGNKGIQKFTSNFLKEFHNLLSDLPKIKIINYLNGLFCGDGGINLSGNVRRIFVSFFQKEDRNKIINLFFKLKINSYISGNEIFISNLSDLFKLYKSNFFDKHPSKRLQLLELLLSYRQFQGRARNIKIQFEKQKNCINNEYKELLSFINNRNNFFNNSFLFCENKIQQTTNMYLPTEIKLNGLARKPKRFIASEIVCTNSGITHKKIMEKVNLTYPSVKHITERLLKEKYIRKEHFQPFNRIKVFPTIKLIKGINSARDLRNDFEIRYKIPEVIKNAV